MDSVRGAYVFDHLHEEQVHEADDVFCELRFVHDAVPRDQALRVGHQLDEERLLLLREVAGVACQHFEAVFVGPFLQDVHRDLVDLFHQQVRVAQRIVLFVLVLVAFEVLELDGFGLLLDLAFPLAFGAVFPVSLSALQESPGVFFEELLALLDDELVEVEARLVFFGLAVVPGEHVHFGRELAV